MRRRRSTRYLPTLLTLAVGVVAVPSRVGAGAEPADLTDEASTVPAPPADDPTTPAPTPAPPDEDPPPTAEPALPTATTPTTVPAPTGAPTVTAAPTPPTPPTTAANEADDPAGPVTEGTPAPEATTAPTTSPLAPAPQVDSPPAEHPTPADDDELDADASVVLPDGEVRTIAFPVLGPVQFGNDWGNCRAGCTRRHQGNDMIGARMQPLLAAVDGTVTRVRYENVGTAGAVITITGADGWYYNYFHLNNDTPGTDDGAAGHEWQIAPQLAVGSTVRAGQVIAYMGDSGNAEGSVPHLHFEIRRPDRTPVNPYRSLLAAQRRAVCGAGVPLLAPDAAALSAAVVAVIPLDGGGRWLIDADGRVFADGSAARIAPLPGVTCDAVAPAATAPAPPVATVAPLGGEVAPVADAVSPGVPVAAPSTPPPSVPSAPTPAPVPQPQPAAPTTERRWTVARGDSLWTIVQAVYAASEDARTIALVHEVFEHNRDVLRDPDVLEIGMTLRLPRAV